MKTWFLLLAGLLLLAGPLSAHYPDDFDTPLTRIAFGSCNHQWEEQAHWRSIRAANPDLWVWLGDNIYASRFGTDMDAFANAYVELYTDPRYAAFREDFPIIGIWDDHDFGVNNGDGSYPHKLTTADYFRDFLEVPAEAPRRAREGIYATYAFGEPGRQVRFLLLDTRYFSTAPGPDGDLLGEAQWAWFEATLRASEADIHIIASGIQILPTDHEFEKWSNYPRSRARLLGLLRSTAVPGVIFVSGDRHVSEISMINNDFGHYPLYELTSSGLTHSWASRAAETNRYRVAPLFTERGFGVIEIDWEAPGTPVSLQIRDLDNRTARRVDLRLDNISPHKDLE